MVARPGDSRGRYRRNRSCQSTHRKPAPAGGPTQIQAQIQAAVDQANTAFINSQMTARFFLAHSAEVAYNDTGNMNSDLDWVTADAGVAGLRNTYSADMVSLIVDNGGPYCGIGWVQRNPGSGFAGYAFQATDRGCLPTAPLPTSMATTWAWSMIPRASAFHHPPLPILSPSAIGSAARFPRS